MPAHVLDGGYRGKHCFRAVRHPTADEIFYMRRVLVQSVGLRR